MRIRREGTEWDAIEREDFGFEVVEIDVDKIWGGRRLDEQLLAVVEEVECCVAQRGFPR